MACNFRADQFEAEFKAPRLGNWQVPKWHPAKPLARTSSTKIISNDRGHLLPGVPRPLANPWGQFQGTWQMPDKISKYQAAQISAPQPRESRWAKSSKQPRNINVTTAEEPEQKEETKMKKCPVHGKKTKVNVSDESNGAGNEEEEQEDTNGYAQEASEEQHQQQVQNSPGGGDYANTETEEDMENEYLPGDFTEPHQRHSSRQLLEEQRRNKDRNYSPPPQLNPLFLQSHDCDYSQGCPLPIDKRRTVSPHLLDECVAQIPGIDSADEMRRDVTEKPGEWNSEPMVPAVWNFQAARKMAVENLEHQPLPDSIMDKAFRRVQAQGALNPELALNVFPTATGVGVKTYMAGPTQCTKMKIYRPKTCGVVPRPLDRQRYATRPHTCTTRAPPLGAMDLAIQWDYRPRDPRDEPQRAAHIDGTEASPGPAIFTVVKTPRTPHPAIGAFETGGRAGGVFANTTGENDFFDADIVRRAAPFGDAKATAERSCHCDESAQQADRYNRKHYTADALEQLDSAAALTEARRASRASGRQTSDSRRRCKSSPNLSKVVHVGSLYAEGKPAAQHHHHLHHHHHSSKHHKNKVYKTARLCDEYRADELPNKEERHLAVVHHKQPFKSGIPNSNASGTCISFDSGCGSVASGSSAGSTAGGSTLCSSKTHVQVPKLRHPYAKRDYAIETLAPPFACWRGGAGQGGYPEHWRLASVYQHAYKPIEQRRRPLLATVYQ